MSDPKTAYLTMEEAAAYLRFPSKQALYVFRYKTGMPKGSRFGRRVLFRVADLDRVYDRLKERRRE